MGPGKPNDQNDPAFQSMVEGAPDGMVISRDGVVLYANPAAVRLLGYDSPSELIGASMAKFLEPQSLTTMRRRIDRMRVTGESPSPREYQARRRDGTIITAEISSIFIDFDGKPAVLAFARDVTERGRLRAQLAHADRLAALGIMAAGVAHEINNPLQFVMLGADLLERRTGAKPDSEMGQLVANIRTGIQRVAAIVRDLRTYGQYEDVAVGPVDLERAIDSAERIVAHELRSRVRVVKDCSGLPAVLGAYTRLEQVFVNLLLNATHAMPDGKADGQISIRARAGKREVVVEVIDNGTGISAELLPRIFEPFFTTKPSTAGSGLGLSICRDIVTRLGGDISATSEPGRGTTMRIVVPRASDGAGGNITTPPPFLAPGRRRILVIDDEPLIVSMVIDILKEKHDVVGETNPERGLGRILSDVDFDLVMCDLMMPGMSGMEIYAQVARERPGLERRFVFVTAGPYTGQAQAFLAGVPNARLIKPLSASELQLLVHQASYPA
jgi:PAS domain S-box-containing protein